MVAKAGGEVASNTKKDIEEKLGKKIVTSSNYLNYEYKDDNTLIEGGY